MSRQQGLDMAAVGRRIRALRQQRQLSLGALAERSGVSVSMLSTVERGQKVPSILVMSQIATALDTSIARLVDEEKAPRVVLLRAAEQRVIKDPAGIERRSLSPVLPGIEFELMRMTLAPGVDAGTFPPHRAGSREYLAVETGRLTLTLDGAEYTLKAGDSIYHDGDCVHGYRNDGNMSCTYYLAMDVAGRAIG
jgi:XRE family transcriptional regulator, regulator of sulfur utilization